MYVLVPPFVPFPKGGVYHGPRTDSPGRPTFTTCFPRGTPLIEKTGYVSIRAARMNSGKANVMNILAPPEMGDNYLP